MTQSQRIVAVLKDGLKQQGLTYDDVASRLNLSASSVKRLFSKGGFTLERLEQIADLAGLDLVELARRGEDERSRITRLSWQTEEALVGDPRLVLVAICALNRWRFDDILRTYAFTEPELIRLLVRLDKLGLIELLPGNRIRVLVDRDFSWLPSGPIHQFFVTQFQDQFLAGKFDAPDDVYEFRWGMVASASAHQVARQLRAVLEEFSQHTHADEVRPREDIQGMCLLTAFKAWEPNEFDGMRR